MNNFKKYLPSKNFATIVLTIIVFITLFFVIKGAISFFKNRITGSDNSKPVKMTVGNLIQKDSNNNGIADWEEYLWGLDPSKNGQANKEFIMAKKKTLTENGVLSIPDDSNSITQNDMLSKEFFAAIISLQQTGNLNDESMNSISESLGGNIATTDIGDIYTNKDLIIQSDSPTANSTYRNTLSALINKYTDANIGSELTFIVQGLSNQDPQALYAAKTVGDAYISFGQDLIKIPVPRNLAIIHLSMANNYEKTGQAINNLTKILNDPITGMRALLSYKKYNDALATDLEKLSGLLQ